MRKCTITTAPGFINFDASFTVALSCGPLLASAPAWRAANKPGRDPLGAPASPIRSILHRSHDKAPLAMHPTATIPAVVLAYIPARSLLSLRYLCQDDVVQTLAIIGGGDARASLRMYESWIISPHSLLRQVFPAREQVARRPKGRRKRPFPVRTLLRPTPPKDPQSRR